VLIIASLVLYFVGDRFTPSTSQARIQAFVVPVAAEVAGKVLAVHIRNNVEVQPGQALFRHRPAALPNRVGALARRPRIGAQFDQGFGGRRRRGAGVAGGVRGQSRHGRTRRQAGWKSCMTRIPARSRCAASRSRRPRVTRRAARCTAPRPTCARRKEAAGEAGDDNAQLRSAVAAVEKAELDLARTQVVAPARGVVTDLRTDVGQFAQPGAPVMTLIAVHDLWISADLTENNIGHVNPGDPVAIVLDAMPGEVLKGRVRSIGGGRRQRPVDAAGTLPVVQNNRDWLRQAQRIPVAVEFDADVRPRLKAVRIGGQADCAGLHRRSPADEPAGRAVHARRQLVQLPVLSSDMARGDKAALRLTIGLGLAVFVAYGPGAAGTLCRLHHGACSCCASRSSAADGQVRS
jgi:multidrug resistance efflux pump